MAINFKKPKLASVTNFPAKFSFPEVENVAALDEAAARIRAQIATMHDAGAAIGRELIAIKKRLSFGEWGNWLSAEFDMSERTAQNYMRVAKFHDEVGTEVVAALPVAAQYALAAPSTPQTAKDTIIGAIKAGDKVSVESVKAQIADAKSKSDQSSKIAAVIMSKGISENHVAAQAVKLLQERLGGDLAEFEKLYRKAGTVFGRKLRKALKPEVPSHAG